MSSERKGKMVYVYEINGFFLKDYKSIKHASTCLKIHHNTITNVIKTQKLFKQKYYFSYSPDFKINIDPE